MRSRKDPIIIQMGEIRCLPTIPRATQAISASITSLPMDTLMEHRIHLLSHNTQIMAITTLSRILVWTRTLTLTKIPIRTMEVSIPIPMGIRITIDRFQIKMAGEGGEGAVNLQKILILTLKITSLRWIPADWSILTHISFLS